MLMLHQNYIYTEKFEINISREFRFVELSLAKFRIAEAKQKLIRVIEGRKLMRIRKVSNYRSSNYGSSTVFDFACTNSLQMQSFI